MEKIDSIDRTILKVLQQNAKSTAKDIAKFIKELKI